MEANALLLPLFEGLYEAAPWQRFLAALLRRTGGDRLRLMIASSAEPARPRWHERAVAGPALGSLGAAEAEALALLPLAVLRRGRVYALEELRALAGAPGRAGEDAALATARVGDLRAIRVESAEGLAATLLLLAEGEGALRAADAALLSALAPALAVALGSAMRLARLELRAAAAEETLARLGITQVLTDGDGQVLAGAEPLAEAPPGACRLADGGTSLLRALPPGDKARLVGAEMVAIRRGPRRPPTAQGTLLLAGGHGLSPREAELADCIARGVPLAEAARQLGLSEASARVYSKRIFAKAGASGQPDLTRRVLEGLSVLG